MKSNLKSALRIIVCASLLTFGCKRTASNKNPIKENNQSQANVKKEFSMPALDSTLNPLVVLKDYVKVFADTMNVQMYELTIEPGDSIPLHQHLDYSVYVLQGGKFILYVNGKDPVEMEIKEGRGSLNGPLIDAAKNTGETTIKLIVTEIHRPRVN